MLKGGKGRPTRDGRGRKRAGKGMGSGRAGEATMCDPRDTEEGICDSQGSRSGGRRWAAVGGGGKAWGGEGRWGRDGRGEGQRGGLQATREEDWWGEKADGSEEGGPPAGNPRQAAGDVRKTTI